jgi:hypothetical protein
MYEYLNVNLSPLRRVFFFLYHCCIVHKCKNNCDDLKQVTKNLRKYSAIDQVCSGMRHWTRRSDDAARYGAADCNLSVSC